MHNKAITTHNLAIANYKSAITKKIHHQRLEFKLNFKKNKTVAKNFNVPNSATPTTAPAKTIQGATAKNWWFSKRKTKYSKHGRRGGVLLHMASFTPYKNHHQIVSNMLWGSRKKISNWLAAKFLIFFFGLEGPSMIVTTWIIRRHSVFGIWNWNMLEMKILTLEILHCPYFNMDMAMSRDFATRPSTPCQLKVN